MGLAREQMCPLNLAGCCQGKPAAVSRVNQQEKLGPGCSALQIQDPAAPSEPGKEKCSVHQQPLVGRSAQTGRPLRTDPTSPGTRSSTEPTLAVPASPARDSPGARGIRDSESHEPNHLDLGGASGVGDCSEGPSPRAGHGPTPGTGPGLSTESRLQHLPTKPDSEPRTNH